MAINLTIGVTCNSTNVRCGFVELGDSAEIGLIATVTPSAGPETLIQHQSCFTLFGASSLLNWAPSICEIPNVFRFKLDPHGPRLRPAGRVRNLTYLTVTSGCQ